MSFRRMLIVIFSLVVVFLIGLRLGESNRFFVMLQHQIAEILTSQRDVEKRLAAMEANQRNVNNLFQALKAPAAAARQMPQEDPNKVYAIPVGHSLIQGPQDAKVTIVEFVDFQCPYCKKFHPVIPQVLAAYPKDVKYILKNYPLPFHQQAEPAARATLAARNQGKYWEMVDLVLANAESLNEEKYKALAGQLGLNLDQFLKDYNDPVLKQFIQEDMRAAQQANVTGTPTYYINGKKTMARDLAGFQAEINQILAK